MGNDDKLYGEADVVALGACAFWAVMATGYVALELKEYYDKWVEKKKDDAYNKKIFEGGLTREQYNLLRDDIIKDWKHWSKRVESELSSSEFYKKNKKGIKFPIYKKDSSASMYNNKMYMDFIWLDFRDMRENWRSVWECDTPDDRAWCKDFIMFDGTEVPKAMKKIATEMSNKYKRNIQYAGYMGDHKDGPYCLVTDSVDGARVYDLFSEAPNQKLKLYHVAEDKVEEKKLSPRIPSNFLVDNGFEDAETPRICFATNIKDALVAMSRNLAGKILYVYETEVDPQSKNFYSSEELIDKVPDVLATNEVWWCEDITAKYSHAIKVTKAQDKPYEYTYGEGKVAELYVWEYELYNDEPELHAESHGISHNMSEKEAAYRLRNKRNLNVGKCRYCKRDTPWIEERGKYQILCGQQICKDKANEEFRARMKKAHGVEYVTDSNDMQREKLMANRKIAKVYMFGDMKFNVLSKLEYEVLRILDKTCKRDPKTVHAPAPFVIQYKHDTEGMKDHFPDIYLEDLELIISVKDGLDNPNKHPNFRKDRLKSLCEYRHILNNTNYNFLQVEGEQDLKEIPKIIKRIEQMYPRSRYISPPRVDMYMYYAESDTNVDEEEGEVFLAIINDKLPAMVAITLQTHAPKLIFNDSKGTTIVVDPESFSNVKYYKYESLSGFTTLNKSARDYNYLVDLYMMLTGDLPDNRYNLAEDICDMIRSSTDEFDMDATVAYYRRANSGNFKIGGSIDE